MQKCTAYYYLTNLQGDVMAILNNQGQRIISYSYDAWGNLLNTVVHIAVDDANYAKYQTLANFNPLRYRGYVYDTETGLYYLQSRYYDPEIGRFINADILTSTGQGLLGNNMFSYCLNNPVNCSDSSGKFALSSFLGAVVGGAIGGAIISTVSHVVNCAINGQELTAQGLANAAITGAVTELLEAQLAQSRLQPNLQLL